MSWLSGWSYRKKLGIAGSSVGAQTDYAKLAEVFSGYLASTFPGDVGTSTTAWGAQGAQHQNRVFYAKGRYWYLYGNGTDAVFRSSADGVTWSAATICASGSSAPGSDWIVDDASDYVHMCYYTGPPTVIYYKRGALAADGTISWDAVQTAKTAGSGFWFLDPHIMLDSNGYPWIAHGYLENATNNAWVYAIKSSTKDGTWTLEFTQQINSTLWSGYAWGSLVRLSSGKVYVTGSSHNFVAEGRLYNGSSWGSTETVTSTAVYGGGLSTVADEWDNVFATFAVATDITDVRCVKRTYISGIWGAEEAVGAVTTAWQTSAIYNNEVYALGIVQSGADMHIKYTRRTTAGAWDTIRVLRVATGILATFGSCHVPYNGSLIFYFSSGAASPYRIRVTICPLGDTIFSPASCVDDVTLIRCRGHALSDLGDVRFTKSDGVTLIPYWAEYEINDGYMTVWADVDSIPADPGIGYVYLYYGKVGESSVSDGEAAFLFYDHFLGDALDGAKWDTLNAPTIAVAGSKVTITTPGPNGWRGITTKNTYGPGVRQLINGSLVSGPAGANHNNMFGFAKPTWVIDKQLIIYYGVSAGNWCGLQSTDNGVDFDSNAISEADSGIHDYEIVWKTAGGVSGKGAVDRILKASNSNYIPSLAIVASAGVWCAAAQVIMDWLFVSKYVVPEPLWHSIGTEETPAGAGANVSASIAAKLVAAGAI